ncbi:MAG: RDD family protein [Cyclobacteriaceae bacterium]
MGGAKYKYAGYWPRMWAYNTDLVILLAVYYLISLVVTTDRLMYLVCFLITVFYHAIFESSHWQATPGKRLLKLKVVGTVNEEMSLAKTTGRFLLKIVSLFIFYIGFIMIGFSKKGQGLHDKIIGTYVIYEDPELLSRNFH